MEHKSLVLAIVTGLALVACIESAPEPGRRRLLRLMERERLAALASENNGSEAGASASAGGAGASASAGLGSYGSRYSEPFSMERINRGIATILNGVRSGSLEEILRGSFMFTRNNNVRGVADNVISSVFGTPLRNEGNLDAAGQPLNADIRGGNNNKNNQLNSAVGSSSSSGSTSSASGSTNARG